jgi:hypothetical protein
MVVAIGQLDPPGRTGGPGGEEHGVDGVGIDAPAELHLGLVSRGTLLDYQPRFCKLELRPMLARVCA